MIILRGHGSGKPIYGMSFSPAGTHLASSSLDETVRLWDLSTGRNRIVSHGTSYFVAFSPTEDRLLYEASGLTLLPAHSESPALLDPPAFGWAVFSHDGRHVVASEGPRLHFHDADTGRRRSTATVDNVDQLILMAASADGRFVAARGLVAGTGHLAPDDPVLLLELPSGREVARLNVSARVGSLAISSDSRLLAGAVSTALIVWEIPTGKVVFRDQPDRRHFNGVAFTPDGRWLAAAHGDNCVRLYATNAPAVRETLDLEIGPIVSVCVAPDGMRAAAGSKKGKIVVWDIDP